MPDVHAEPADTPMPARSSPSTMDSDSTFLKHMLQVPGSRSVGWPLSRTSGTRAVMPSHNRFRRAVARTASSAMSRARTSTALPNPTMPATFSVPARRRRSCSPPCCTDTILVPRRMKRPATPLGP